MLARPKFIAQEGVACPGTVQSGTGIQKLHVSSLPAGNNAMQNDLLLPFEPSTRDLCREVTCERT